MINLIEMKNIINNKSIVCYLLRKKLYLLAFVVSIVLLIELKKYVNKYILVLSVFFTHFRQNH